MVREVDLFPHTPHTILLSLFVPQSTAGFRVLARFSFYGAPLIAFSQNVDLSFHLILLPQLYSFLPPFVDLMFLYLDRGFFWTPFFRHDSNPVSFSPMKAFFSLLHFPINREGAIFFSIDQVTHNSLPRSTISESRTSSP